MSEPRPSGPILRRTFGPESTGLRILSRAEESVDAVGSGPVTRSRSTSTRVSRASGTAERVRQTFAEAISN